MRAPPRFSVERFLSHSTERIHKGTLRGFEIFQASKLFMQRGYHHFPLRKFFCPTVPKNVIRETFCGSKNSQFAKNFGWEGWVLRFRSNFYCLTLQKTILCFGKLLVSKKITVRSGGGRGFHNLLSKVCGLKKPEKKRRGFFCVSENFWYRQFYVYEGEEERLGRHYFPSTVCCVTVPEDFLEKTFGVSEIFDYRNFLCIRGKIFIEPFDVPEFFKHPKCSCIGGITFFQWAVLCPTVPKNVIWETFCFSKNFSILKNYGWEWWVLRFPSNFFCLTLQKTIYVFQKRSGIEEIYS